MSAPTFIGTLWLDGSEYATRHQFCVTDYWLRSSDDEVGRVRVYEADPATHSIDVEEFASRDGRDWAYEDYEAVR